MDFNRDARFVVARMNLLDGREAYRDTVAKAERIAALHRHPRVTVADVDQAIVVRIVERRTGNVPAIHRF